jgi:hypothetical protein
MMDALVTFVARSKARYVVLSASIASEMVRRSRSEIGELFLLVLMLC